MIIGFDGSRAFSATRTGTENYSYQLLKALAKIDKKNKYIVYLRPHSVISNKVRDPKINLHTRPTDVEIPRFTRNDNNGWPSNFEFKVIKWPRLWTQGGLAKQTFQDNLDVLFIPAHTSPLIHKPGLKTVVTVHDLGAEYLPRMHQLKQRLYLKWITHYQLKSATKLIAVSKATKDDLVKKVGIDSKKIEVVYEGYNKELFYDTKSNIKKQYYLFVGTIQPRKNLERIIKAFDIYSRSLENIPSLMIVGSKGWLSDDIYKLPKKLGIEEKVKFLGRVEDKDLPGLYRGAKALLFPSLFEGFGLPILEAQACGCPVITSNISSMPEVAGKGAILVDPYSVDSIIKGMEKIMIKDLRLKIKESGFENVKRFSWEKAAKETLEVLEGV